MQTSHIQIYISFFCTRHVIYLCFGVGKLVFGHVLRLRNTVNETDLFDCELGENSLNEQPTDWEECRREHFYTYDKVTLFTLFWVFYMKNSSLSIRPGVLHTMHWVEVQEVQHWKYKIPFGYFFMKINVKTRIAKKIL